MLALRIPQARDEAGKIRYLDLTFAELDREADHWAAKLNPAGINQGTRVLLLVTPGLSLISICFALFKIGAVPVVIDPGMGLRSFLRCVTHTKPEAVVAIPRGIFLSRIFRPTFSSVRTRISVHTKRRAPGAEAGAPKTFPVAATSATDPAAILFTSGSTGTPKGVCYEHGMFEAQVRTIRDSYDIQPGEVDLPMLPVFALFNPALGMTTVVPEINPSRPATVDPAAIVQAIQQCKVTSSFGSPVIWRKIADHCRAAGVTLPTVKRVLMAGAPVPPALMKDFSPVIPNGVIHSPYGATEALPVTTVSAREILEHTVSQTLRGRGTCVGRPVSGVTVKIIPISDEPISSEKETRFLHPGEIGEIIVRGPQVTKSYDQFDGATAAAKISIGGDASTVWHRMGDTGYIDEDGRLWFCGRKAERVVTRETVLFTDCCEPVFNQHHHVARSALIGIGPRGEQQPAIVVEPTAGHWPSTPAGRLSFAKELGSLAEACETTRGIKQFFFHRCFPVDVRHNAKIHRLKLAKHFANLQPVSLP